MGLHRLLSDLRGRLHAKKADAAYQRAVACHQSGDLPGCVDALREAADYDHPDACYQLGCLYESGQGIESDVQKAIDHFERAARWGSSQAMLMLVRRYAAGDGVKQDLGRVRTLLGQAAELGEGAAMGLLGMAYIEGKGGPVDMDLGVHWLREAAEQRDGPGCAHLGMLYENGQGVAADPAQAFLWYRRAAEVGNAIGQYNLARAYETGIGVNEDLEAAALWHLRAAEQGLAEAQLAIGRCLVQGRGVEKDPAAGARWQRRAVDQQHPLSMVFLAGLYADGLGVDKDLQMATDLLDRARELGVDVSEVYGMVLKQRLTAQVESPGPSGVTGAAPGMPSDPTMGGPPSSNVDTETDEVSDPTYLDRRSCFFAFHLLPQWLFAAPHERALDAAAMTPVIEALWGEAWRLALPYAKHSWTAASAPDCIDIEVDGHRWLCVSMDCDTMPPSPFFLLVRRDGAQVEIWLAELSVTGQLLLAQIKEEGEHSVRGQSRHIDPQRLAVALTKMESEAELVDHHSSSVDLLQHMVAYLELNQDFETARGFQDGAPGRT